ncbi:putative calponin domain, CH domain superfamily, fimbrin/Plastin [Plasmopara halstedii]
MEPLSATLGQAVPKLHLTDSGTRKSSRTRENYFMSERPAKNSFHRHPETPTSVQVGKMRSARVLRASVELFEAFVLPPMQLRSTSQIAAVSSHQKKQVTATELPEDSKNDRDRDLRPIIEELLDKQDDELACNLLNRWSTHSSEEHYASISLFCEMKLNEAKCMASRAETPNRFYTVVCCQLLEKYISHVALSKMAYSNVDPVAATNKNGQSFTFLQKIHDGLIASIFLPPTQQQAQDQVGYRFRTPFFTELKRARFKAQALITTVKERERARTTTQQLSNTLSKLITRMNKRQNCRTLALTFHWWVNTMAAQHQIRALKLRAFQCARKTNLIGSFRVWRIEALRRAYQRESTEYQAMLSVTAASISKKDIAIAEAEAKVTSMASIIDSLKESNQQLSHRINYLESLTTASALSNEGESHGLNDRNFETRPEKYENLYSGHTLEANFEHINSVLTQDDERMDRTNCMLLEILCGMARMVETCTIQLSKVTMDSLENQLDGSVLQHLADTIQSENERKAKVDAAEGCESPHFSKTSTSTAVLKTSSLAAARPYVITIHDLADLPIDTLLLHWFRMHLSSSAAEKPTYRTIKNFTSDLADGRRFSFLLHRLFPSWFDASMVHEPDRDKRLKNIATFHERIQPPLPQVVTSSSIHAASGTENIAFVAMLFGATMGTIRNLSIEKQRGDYFNIVTIWRRICGLLLEVKRMNDNYDVDIVSHLLKEMRTCETSLKQLHLELHYIAVTSSEASSALSQIACKTLAITWSCVRAREAYPEAPLQLVDERAHEHVHEFSRVDTSCIRVLLVQDSMNNYHHITKSKRCKKSTTFCIAEPAMLPVVPERDVDIVTGAVRRALLAYSKDLNEIFKHYSASGGAGSLAAMSFIEFNKFIKDCFPGDKYVTAQVVDTVFKAASPLPLTDKPGELSFGIPLNTQVTDENGSVKGIETQELSGRHFADALVRLAAVKYAPIPESRASPLEGQTHTASLLALPLDERFRLLMKQDVLPHALRSQRELFRAEVARSSVCEVFQRHKSALQRIFRYYASMHAIREQNSTLPLSGFIVMARDCKIFGTFVSQHMLSQLFVSLQRDDSTAPSYKPAIEVVRMEGELDVLRIEFDDFNEILAALTEYVICNPYIALHKRVDQFLLEILLPRARQRKDHGE